MRQVVVFRARRSGGLIGRLLGVLIALSLAVVAAPRAGAVLVVEDPFAKAELVVVLSGAPVARALAAADLYKQHRAERILVIPEPPDPADPELVRLGLRAAGEAPMSARVLKASGVPADRIAFLDKPVDGTLNEALRVREYLGERVPRRLVLVTSSFATRRARYIFRSVFKGRPVEVLAYPSRLDSFSPDQWWAHPRNALTVVMEYQKFATNAATLACCVR